MYDSPFRDEPAESGSAGDRIPGEMHYFEAYSYYFNGPNWAMNILLATICQIIPVVGPIVLLGYEYELLLAKHLRTTRTYPDFDFGRFSEYLSRGVWPFLVLLIQALVMTPLMMITFFIIFMLGGMSVAAQGPDPNPLVVLAIFPAMFVVFAIFMTVSALVMTPLVIRAGLTCDLGKTFDWEFVKDFIHRVGWETLYATGFLMIGGMILGLLGLLACYFGMFPATTLNMLAYTHLKWQLYELYLDRGGMPIPLPADEVIQADRA